MDKARLSEIAGALALCRSLPGSASAAARRAAARLDDAVPQQGLDRPAADGRAREGVKFSAAATNHRHCEEPLRRSNPGCCLGNRLDCFAALAMTRKHHAPHTATSFRYSAL